MVQRVPYKPVPATASLTPSSTAMSAQQNPFSSQRFRLACIGNRPRAVPVIWRGLRRRFQYPVLAFMLGVISTFIANRIVHHCQIFHGSSFMPLTLIPYRLFANTTLTSVAPRNIALFGGGARVNPLLTSATYDPREHGPYLLDAFRWIRDTMLGVEFSRLHLSRPRDALSENMELGKCWEIEGSMGHLAVQLPDVVAVTDVSVDHVPPHLLSRADVGRAPKGITIWALVNDTTARRFPESRSPALFAANFRTPSPIRLTDRFIKLKEFAFDIHSSLHHQFFAVDPSASDVQTSLVVVEITSNHGSNTTCLYYVGVYGTTMSP